MDDLSALELDNEVDADMRALFGDSQESAGPSTQAVSMAPLHMHRQISPLLNACTASTVDPYQTHEQAMSCITNKRPAALISDLRPQKLRQPLQPALHSSVSYDDLELEAPSSSVFSGITTADPNNEASRQNSTTTFGQRSEAFGAVFRPNSTAADTDSQVTEQWSSASNSQAKLQSRPAVQQCSHFQQPHPVSVSMRQPQAAPDTSHVSIALVSTAAVIACRCPNVHAVEQLTPAMMFVVSTLCALGYLIQFDKFAGSFAPARSSWCFTKSTSSRLAHAPLGRSGLAIPVYHLMFTASASARDASRVCVHSMAVGHGSA